MTVIEEVAAERARQIEIEGWTHTHDDNHDFGELAAAGSAYALCAADQLHPGSQGDGDFHRGALPVMWPWDSTWWKPKGPRRDLVRAAALIVAEVEKLDRDARRTFLQVVRTMGADNGCHFTPTEAEIAAATPVVASMMDAGYFRDDPEDIEHSFWQAAAGEESEARQFFQRAPDAYAQLTEILTAIFDRGGDR